MKIRIKKIDTRFIRSSLVLEIIASIIAGISAVFWSALVTSELWLFDQKLYLKAKIAPAVIQKNGSLVRDVTVLSITEDNLADFGKRTPVNRRFIADLIHDIQRYQPAVVAVDYLFDRPLRRSAQGKLHPDDKYLLKTLNQYNNIILASRLIETGNGFVPSRTQFLKKHIMPSNAFLGIANTHISGSDSRKVWRRTAFLYPDTLQLQPSFAFISWLRSKVDAKQLKNALQTKTTFMELLKKLKPAPNKILENQQKSLLINYSTLFSNFVVQSETCNRFRLLSDIIYTFNRGEKSYEGLTLQQAILLKRANILTQEGFSRRIKTEKQLQKTIKKLPKNIQQAVTSIWKNNNLTIPYIKNKIVLIGAQYYNNDLHVTPFTKQLYNREYGVSIQARIINMLLKKEFIHEASTGINFIITLLNLFLLLWYMYTFPFKKAIFCFLTHFLLYICINFTFFLLFSIQFSMIPFLILSLILATLLTLIRFIYTERTYSEMRDIFGRHASTTLVSEMIQNSDQDYFETRESKGCLLMACWPEISYTENQLSLTTRKKILNDYYFYIGNLVKENRGFFFRLPINGIMAAWNIYNKNEKKPQEIIQLTHELLKINKMLNEKWSDIKKITTGFTIDIGLHQGTVIAGLSGIKEIRDFTIEGSDVAQTIALAQAYADDTESWVLLSKNFYTTVSNLITTKTIQTDKEECYRFIDFIHKKNKESDKEE